MNGWTWQQLFVAGYFAAGFAMVLIVIGAWLAVIAKGDRIRAAVILSVVMKWATLALMFWAIYSQGFWG